MIYGNLDVKLDNKHHLLKPGDILHIPILSKHSFSPRRVQFLKKFQQLTLQMILSILMRR